MSSFEYDLWVKGPDLTYVGRLELECEDEQDAINYAFSFDSPFGHDLVSGERFVGAFPPGGRGAEEEGEGEG